MSDVVDIASRRADRDRCPSREPDFTVSGWVGADGVEWAYSTFPLAMSAERRVDVLRDAAWMVASKPGSVDDPTAPRPLFWWHLSSDGSQHFDVSRSIDQGTSFVHAWWFVKQWWRLTKRCALVAWRMWRGRG